MTPTPQFKQPVVAVGGIVIVDGRALLIRRGQPPREGEWSIPGGHLELGETLTEALEREMLEETGLHVRVGPLIEALERIFRAPDGAVEYHYVILDYLCEQVAGTPRPGGDVSVLAWAAEDELLRFHLTEAATRVLKKAFAMARQRGMS